MNLTFSKPAKKAYQYLPRNIQIKADKQFTLLLTNYHHPSLKSRKMSGEDKFEARIDRKYRFTFQIEAAEIYILTIGPHDIGLGKKS